MNPTHYLDVMLRAPEISRELHARLLTVAHHRILAGDALAVAWPDWRHEHGEFGFLFRVFGDAGAVGRYLDGVEPMVERELIRLYPVVSVPDVASRVVFARDRGVDRHGPSATRRMTRSGAKAARSGLPTQAGGAQRIACACAEKQ